ncbi:MAG: thiol reductase thioredoxin [Phycisphaerales bacterium]|nr:thioredoxin family protein [Phycisphaerae bacterium]NNF45030.1 thiol reductase thioredoxin [Phycisphaerales bacterium]NNM27631.1 thiol reductase thioredoxin [Phycisphaerales bacterium]
MLMNAEFLHGKFQTAVPYAAFVALGAPDGHDHAWRQRYEQLALDAEQQNLTGGFTRAMKVLCLTGTWCGDCALQGAAMQRVAEAAPNVELRFLLRTEEHADLIVPNQINGGFRVPVTWFMAEDFEPVSRMGDRTLSRYRSMARKTLGPAAPVVASPPADPVRAVLGEVLDEFERVQLVLRLSPRLRERHGD